jgi:hypothetical protein
VNQMGIGLAGPQPHKVRRRPSYEWLLACAMALACCMSLLANTAKAGSTPVQVVVNGEIPAEGCFAVEIDGVLMVPIEVLAHALGAEYEYDSDSNTVSITTRRRDEGGSPELAAGDALVYISKNGKKYHVEGCRYLSTGAEAVSLDTARQRGYEPCKVCNPPERHADLGRVGGSTLRRQVIGVLFSSRDWDDFLSGTGSEDIDLYMRAAETHGVTVVFFRLSDIDPKAGTVAAMWRPCVRRWVQVRVPLPPVIHNRAVHRVGKVESQLAALRDSGITIYNHWNNYGKYTIHRHIYSNLLLRRYLPETRWFTSSNLKRFLRHDSFLMKPDRGSVGLGIIKIDRASRDSWTITHQVKDRTAIDKVPTRRLFDYLRKRAARRWYILQKTIDLQRRGDAPFDIRVSVQRDGTGNWQVTGMVGKVARKGGYLTNVFQGSTVARLEDLFPDRARVEAKLSRAALRIVRHLSKRLPHLADVGFDFGIARNGKPYFIEMNCRDQRYSFKLAGMMDTFRRTYDNPIAYGKLLLLKKQRSEMDRSAGRLGSCGRRA